MVKKISKKFKSFEEEEKWLMELAQDGQRLVSYDDNDVDTNTYKFVEDPSASEFHYQIDYRIFNKKADYEEYKELFAESGWTILSKSWFYHTLAEYFFLKEHSEQVGDECEYAYGVFFAQERMFW